jgi:ATP-dependent RNA helicase RhlE
LTKFTDLGLAEPILRAVLGEGYETPTPIQAGVIPAMTDGADIVGIAQTGTGKTASFVLPMLQRIAAGGKRPDAKSCGALVLAPTRELAAQIHDAIRTYGANLRMSAAVVVGGAKPGPQVRAMARGVDILVATPGRLEDHISTGAIRVDTATTVVLDEADQMLDLGFMPAIRRIMGKLPKGRQTVLMSATMPTQIRKLADDFLNKPQEISVAPQSKPIDRIDQSVMHVSRADKRDKLVSYLKGQTIDRAVVFTRTKHGANKVAQMLAKAGLGADAIHGNKSQNQRIRTLDAFKAGKTPILVATDIAARGIDVDGVSHVVNFDLPEVAEVYVHRIGRTARAGKSGTAVALVDETQRGLLREIEKLTKITLPSFDGSTPDLPEEEPEKRGGKSGHSRGGRGQRQGAGRGNREGRAESRTESRAEDKGPRADGEAQAKPSSRKPRRGRRRAGANAEGGAKSDARSNTAGQRRNKPAQGSKTNARNGNRRSNGQGAERGSDKAEAGLNRMLGHIDRSQERGKRRSA